METIPWVDLVKDLVLIFLLGVPFYLYVYGHFKNKDKRVAGILLGILIFIMHFISSLIPTLTVQFIPFLMIVIFVLNARRQNFRSEIRHPLGFDYEFVKWNLHLVDVVLGFLMGIGMQFVSMIISLSFKGILDSFEIPAPPQPIMQYLFALKGWALVYFIFMAVVMAPVVEEFILRMWLYDRVLKPRMHIKWAMLVSAVVFSILHFNLLAFPSIIIIGLVNCVLYDKKGYWWPVFLHAGFNSVSTFFMLLIKYLHDIGILQDLDKLLQQ